MIVPAALKGSLMHRDRRILLDERTQKFAADIITRLRFAPPTVGVFHTFANEKRGRFLCQSVSRQMAHRMGTGIIRFTSRRQKDGSLIVRFHRGKNWDAYAALHGSADESTQPTRQTPSTPVISSQEAS